MWAQVGSSPAHTPLASTQPCGRTSVQQARKGNLAGCPGRKRCEFGEIRSGLSIVFMLVSSEPRSHPYFSPEVYFVLSNLPVELGGPAITSNPPVLPFLASLFIIF